MNDSGTYDTTKTERSRLIKVGFVFCLMMASLLTQSWVSAPHEMDAVTTLACYKRKPRGDFSYRVVHKEPVMRNLRMVGKVGRCGIEGSDKTERLYGAILRAMRFQNITRKVENKYGLPKNLILAMVIQETGGADLLPNCLDDGGIGLCHMQGSTASSFGVSTYRGFNKLVSKTHGRILRAKIKENNYDRKKLIKYDDRFHPILNLDAAGRMLHCYQQQRVKGLTSMQSGIYRYAGSYNYRHYYRNVQYYRKKLNDPAVIAAVRKTFNRRNSRLLINGKKGNYDAYINAHQEQNENYGLKNYR
ncbi:MAG: hypothetical protein AAF206_02745 [Bacteroidota bacterium]